MSIKSVHVSVRVYADKKLVMAHSGDTTSSTKRNILQDDILKACNKIKLNRLY